MSEFDDFRRRLAGVEAQLARPSLDQLPLGDLSRWMADNRTNSDQDNQTLQHSIRESSIGMLPFAYVHKTTDQSIPNNAWTLLTWQAAQASEAQGDPYGMHDTAALTSRVKAVRAGHYRAHVQAAWAANATGLRALIIQKNGAGALTNADIDWNVSQQACPAPHTTAQQGSGYFYLDVGDYLEVFAFQDSGVALNILGTAAEAQSAKLTVVWQHHNVAPTLPA